MSDGQHSTPAEPPLRAATTGAPDAGGRAAGVSPAGGVEPPVSVEQVARRVQDLLRNLHLNSSTHPIAGSDERGAFLHAAGFITHVLPLVIDANWLRGDVLHACRYGQQTIMLTAANENLVRLYCAPHVIDEVVEHHREWTGGTNVTAAEFFTCWRQQYLALLRVVEPPDGLLTAAEALRIDALRRKDPDDIPSASLALLLEAPFVTADTLAARAVYGPDAAVRNQAELLELLGTAGDAGQLREVLTCAALAPAAGMYGLYRLVALAARTAPWLMLLAGWGGSRISGDAWRQIGRAVGRLGKVMGHTVVLYGELQSRVRAATPPAPTWHDLAAERPASALLARACMRTLAQCPRSQLSAADLARALPHLGIGQHSQAVRRVLRAHGSTTFHEVYRGEWQLGRSCRTAVIEPGMSGYSCRPRAGC